MFRIVKDGKLILETGNIQELIEWIDLQDPDDYDPKVIAYGRYDYETNEEITTHT